VIPTFLLGILASMSPCVLPLYPGFLSYLSAQNEMGTGRYLLGVFVLTGVLSMMLALGGLIALLAVPIGNVLAYVIPLADLLILFMGILLLTNHNPFKTLPQTHIRSLRHPYFNAYAYGLLYGPITLPCSGPLVVGIFALSFTAGEALGQLQVFLWFGLGLGMPLLILSLLSAGLQRQLTTLFARHGRLINFISGLILIGIAIYDLSKNWGYLQLFL
jgi:cytochrome c-type biogenesis protein